MENLKGYIILESAPAEPSIPTIIEDDSKDEVVIEAVLQEAEAPNRNKRKYKKEAIQSGIDNPMFQEKLQRKNLFGEANHPLSDDLERQMWIDQTRMSHIITKVWWEDNILMGRIAAANTRCGKDFAGLVRQGCSMAFSMRGVGGVVKDEGELKVVYAPLIINTYDWIIFPSHPNAYEVRVIKENTLLTRNISNKVINEGAMIPLQIKQSMADYILNENSDLKTGLEQLNINPKNASFDTKKLMLEATTDEGTVKLFLEDDIKKEMAEFLTNFR